MPTPPTIGITSIGAGVGKSVVDACRLSGLSLRLVGMGNNPFAFGAFDCDARTSLPSIDDPGYVDALHQRCREHGISILIPGLDAELLPLANHRERFLADGIDLIVAAEPVVALCVDKLRTFREMAPYSEAFIATAEVAHWGDLTCQQPLPWPLIAKPRGGCASRAVRVINHLDDLQRLGPDDILQRVAIPRQGDPHRQVFLEGLNRGVLVQVSELSVQVVIGKDGRNLGRMATCNRLVNGVPIEIVTVDVPEVWAEIDQMLPRLLTLGLRGPLNIQGRLTDDGPRFVEMNARFTGITGVRAMMGFNEVAAVILDAMNRPVKPCTLRANPRRIGLRLTTDRVVDIYRDEALAQAVEAVDARATAGSGRRVLVTGANSYLGRATLDALLDSPAVAGITALVRNPARFSTGGEPPLPAGVLVHDLDDLWNGTLNMGHYEVLIHLASGRPQHRDETIAESLRLTRDLMTLAAKHQLPGIINASSQSVYGLSRPPLWGEDMSPRPETAYAQAKWAAELMTLIPQQ